MKQSIHIKSIDNARELGGYTTADGRKIKSGLLIRTARLDHISNEDIITLKEVYYLQHIVDFRMSMELPGADDPLINGAQYHHLDVIDAAELFTQGMSDTDFDINELDAFQIAELSVRSGIQNENMYIGFLSCGTGKAAYAAFFHILLAAEPDRAVLWHCTSGKDRTGLASMLLLSALGAEEDVILNDYLLTNEYNAKSIASTKRYMKLKGCDDDFIDQAVLVYNAVDERYMRNAIEYLNNEYGSVVGYIRNGLNITQKDIDSLKEKYLY